MNRRSFLQNTIAFSASLPLIGNPLLSGLYKPEAAPVRAITSGPKHHWFGYYDKLQFDPTSRYALGMQVDFEYRSPAGNDVIRIGMIDLEKGNQWTEIGESRAWGWQQGCMLQWIPGSSSEIIWNDREGSKFVSRVMDIKTKKMRTLPKAIHALTPDGKWGIGTEFSRIQNLRPGYGYAGVKDPYEEKKAPKEIGLYKVNLQTGENTLLFSLADIAAIPHNGESVADNFH
jgi:hypothetical protein